MQEPYDMPLKAHLQPDAAQRTDARRALHLQTSGRVKNGPEANVTIHNISAAGLLIETALELAIGERLELDLPEAGIADAVIVWNSANLYGCAFEQALNPAELAATQLRASAPATLPPLPSHSGSTSDALGPAFGSKLNRLRRERGLTLADVAGALGVSKPTVWAWEKGKARPVPARLDAIAAALDVSREELEEAGAASAEANALISDCRGRIAAALNVAPSAVRIMIEL
jgi:transcriptional regulator with XRE-family HTH domain